MEFDFLARDRMIAALRLPKSIDVSDRSVGASAMKAVLYRIHQHAGNRPESFPGITTLAAATALGHKTVRRAIEALAALGLLSVTLKRSEDSRVVCNHYAIQWEAVLSRQPGSYSGHPEQAAEPGAIGHVCDQKRGAPVAERCQSDRPPGPSDRPPGPSDRPPGTQRSATSGQRTPMEGMEEEEMENSMRDENGVLEIRSGGPAAQGASGASVAVADPQPRTGWTLKPDLDVGELQTAESVQALWELALLQPRLRGLYRNRQEHRLRFFALAQSIWRKREKFANPVGMFHHKLARGPAAAAEQADDAHDFAWAQAAIRGLGQTGDRRPELDDPEAAFVRERHEQQQRLAEFEAGGGRPETAANSPSGPRKSDRLRALFRRRSTDDADFTEGAPASAESVPSADGG
jgi:hypothetical protein